MGRIFPIPPQPSTAVNTHTRARAPPTQPPAGNHRCGFFISFFLTSENHQKWLNNNQNQYSGDQNSLNANITSWICNMLIKNKIQMWKRMLVKIRMSVPSTVTCCIRKIYHFLLRNCRLLQVFRKLGHCLSPSLQGSVSRNVSGPQSHFLI